MTRPTATSRRKLTPKQRVLRKYPNAIVAYNANGFYAGLWCIEDSKMLNNSYSNHHRSARAAWADAARNL